MSISAATVVLPAEPATVDETRQYGGLMDDVRMLWQQLLGLAHDHLRNF